MDARRMTTDHPGITVLSTNACFDRLRGQTIGRLAVSIRDHPDIFPINYVVDRGGIVFRTAEGAKFARVDSGRGVAFEVDGLDDEAGEAWSVVVKGHAVEIERMDGLLDALDLPLFRGIPARSTVSCESIRSKSPGAAPTSSKVHLVRPVSSDLLSAGPDDTNVRIGSSWTRRHVTRARAPRQ